MSDRGRDTSRALTEVRTVLSRAETARDEIACNPYLRDDPDRLAMLAELDAVVERLGRWRRTGRGR